MKRTLFTLTAVALFAACDKIPDDNLLDGMWQVNEITYKADTTDARNNRTYWCFRKQLLEMSDVNSNNYFAHIEHKGDSLFIYDLCFHSTNATETDNNEWMTRQDASLLNTWGIYAENANADGSKLKAAFHIEKKGNDCLMLKNDSSLIRLYKF